jgi:hypothetical protein
VVAVVHVVSLGVPVYEELAYTRQPKQQAPAQGYDVIGTNHSIGLTKFSTLETYGVGLMKSRHANLEIC